MKIADTSFNNSEMAKAVILALCRFQHSVTYIKDICAKFGIHNLLQSPDSGQNSNGGISNFWISGESSMNESGHNSRTSHDIDMKLGPIT